MRRVLLIALLIVPFFTACGDTYLDREEIKLPVNGIAVSTTKPLKPYTRYVIRISSPLDLSPFRTEVKHFFFSSDFYWNFRCNGAKWVFDRLEYGLNGIINHVILEAQGAGEPLHFFTDKNFTADFNAPHLSLLILRSHSWRTDDGTDLRLGIYVVLGIIVLFVLGAFLSHDTALATYTTAVIKPEPPRAPVQARVLPAPPLHQRFKLTPHKYCTSSDPVPNDTEVVVTIEGLWRVSARGIPGTINPDPTLYGIDAQYVGPCTKSVGAWYRHGQLFFDDSPEPADSFRHDRHHHRFSFAYTGTGDKLVLFLEIPSVCADHTFWHDDTMMVTIREMSSADRADIPPEPPAPEPPNVEDEMRQSYLDRIHALEIEFGGRRHLDDSQWVEQYTKKHLHDLLKSRTRIMQAHTKLHADPRFVQCFTETDPTLYARVTWEYRALCLAEELEPGNPVKPTLTPEERQAKFERYRERALERDRIQAEDRMAAVRQKLDLARQFREDLDAYDLDEDERDRIVKEFEDDLLISTEEHVNGYKKL